MCSTKPRVPRESLYLIYITSKFVLPLHVINRSNLTQKQVINLGLCRNKVQRFCKLFYSVLDISHNLAGLFSSLCSCLFPSISFLLCYPNSLAVFLPTQYSASPFSRLRLGLHSLEFLIPPLYRLTMVRWSCLDAIPTGHLLVLASSSSYLGWARLHQDIFSILQVQSYPS